MIGNDSVYHKSMFKKLHPMALQAKGQNKLHSDLPDYFLNNESGSKVSDFYRFHETVYPQLSFAIVLLSVDSPLTCSIIVVSTFLTYLGPRMRSAIYNFFRSETHSG